MYVIELLNNREIAWLIWIVVAINASMFSNSIRKSFWGVIKAFFSWRIFRIWLLMVSYFVLWTWILWYFKLWDKSLLKDTIFFIVFSASITFFKANTISQEKGFFKKMLKDNLKLGVFVEFLMGIYTFSLLAELLFVPIIVLLAGVSVISETDIKYVKVKKLINRILTIGGLYLIYHVVCLAVHNYKSLLTLENLKSFLLSPMYTLVYIPFLYILSIYMVYEVQCIFLDTAIEAPSLKKTAKKYAFLYFRNDLNGLKRWVKQIRNVNPQTQGELFLSIIRLKNHLALEKAPLIISPERGWSPYVALGFMDEAKLKAGDYDCIFDDDWGACSSYLYIGDQSLMNTISYYVNGNETEVHLLELVLKVFQPNVPADLHQQFLNQVEILFKHSTDKPLPRKIQFAILNGKPTKGMHNRYFLELKKERWQNITNGYDLIFSIGINSYKQ